MRKCHDFVASPDPVPVLRRYQRPRGADVEAEMVRLVLAGVLAFGAAACGGGAGDERPAPTVMGEETAPAGTQAPGGDDSDY